jgi:thymidylate synthase
MNRADYLFLKNIADILRYGSLDENPRPRYASDGEFPITTLRPIPIMNGIKEIRWIYQDQTSSLDVLENKYGIKWWRDWDVGDGTIGQRYGATVRKYNLMNNFLNGLTDDPFGRRHILSLWQVLDFKTKGLNPCAYEIHGAVRRFNRKLYFDMTLIQRSSDYLVAGHINKMQYVAWMMMVAKHCGYEVGTFGHYVHNLHIYDRHVVQAKELLSREPSTNQPILKLNIDEPTSFYDITENDFELVGYEPVKPQLKFDLGV